MSKFTQGTWHQGSYFGHCTLNHKHGQGECDYKDVYWDQKCHISVTKEDGSHLVLISNDKHGDILSEDDARLISAAPDLLEAITPFVVANSSEEFVTLVVRSADITKARAAIQKALGETHDQD